MDETYYRVIITPQPRVKPSYIDYYMGKDTSEDSSIIRDIYPDRIITKSEVYDLAEVPFLFYDISLEDYEILKKNPDILGIESPYVSASIFPIQTGTFTTNLRYNYSGDFSASIFDNTCPAVNWGLYWHTQYKTNVDWLKSKSLESSSIPSNYVFYNEDYTTTLDGEGVDLIIFDYRIDHRHPEFLDENGNKRVVLLNWANLEGMEDILQGAYGTSYPNWRELFSNYYDPPGPGFWHGTSVASVAAGKIHGWAKKATLYSLKLLEDGGYYNWINFIAIKKFHEAKPIDPSTGVKRPTIVNMSFGWITSVISRQKLDNFGTLSKTAIQDFIYKGTTSLSSSLGWSGNDNMPGLEYQIRLRLSESFDNIYPYQCDFGEELNYINTLVQDCLDAGVIMVSAAGNSLAVISRENESSIYNSYVVPVSGSNEPGIADAWTILNPIVTLPNPNLRYSNRTCSPSSPPGVICVGALSPNLIIPKSPITNSLSPSFGSIQYDIFGPVRWYFRENIPAVSSSYNHENIINFTLPPDHPSSKRGYGVGDPFPGWNSAYNSASLCIAPFSNTGPSVEIFAAGQYIGAALSENALSGSGLETILLPRSWSLYDPAYSGTNWQGGIVDGTSFASPQVAGVACLYFQMNPTATTNDFRNFLNFHAPKDIRLQVFDEDPQHRIDFSGSLFTNKPYNAQGNIGLFGASTKILHWPFTKVIPLTIS